MAQLTFWTQGGGTYRIEGQAWSFSAPTVSFIPGDIVHGFEIAPGTDAIVMSVEDGALAACRSTSCRRWTGRRKRPARLF